MFCVINILEWARASYFQRLGYWLIGPGSIPDGGGGGDFLHSFVSKVVLGSTQPPLK